MNMNVHIERVLLEGVALSAAQRQALQVAIEVHLARLLGSGSDLLRSNGDGGANVAATRTSFEVGDARPVLLGRQIAASIRQRIKP